MENTETDNNGLLSEHLKQFFSSPKANFGRLEGIHLKQSPGVIVYMGFGHVECGVCYIKDVPAISLRHMDEAMPCGELVVQSHGYKDTMDGSVLIVLADIDSCDAIIRLGNEAKKVFESKQV
jgi:hypothetical protein